MRELLRTKVFASVALALTLTFAGLGTAHSLASAAPAAGQVGHTEVVAQTAQGDTKTDSADTTDPGFEIVVAPLEPVLTASLNEARFRVLLRNTSKQALPEGSIELALGDHITSGSVLTDPAAADGNSPANRTKIASTTVGAVEADGKSETTITVPSTEFPTKVLSSRGVYAVYATYRPADSGAVSDMTAFTPVVWEGTESATATVKLSVIVPLVLPATVQSLPNSDELAQELSSWNGLIDFAMRAHATLAIDPRIVTAIRAYGEEAPEGATALLDRLEHTTLSTFLLQYGDADPAAQAALGSTALMRPVNFSFATRLGSWPAPVSETPQPATPDQGATPSAGDESGATSSPESDSGSAPATSDANSASTEGSGTGDSGTGEPSTGTPSTDTPDSSDPNSGNDPSNSSVPSDAELEAWPGGLHAAWPAPGQVNTATTSLLSATGYDLTVLRSDNVSLSGGPRAKLAGGNALVTDRELDEGIARAYSGDTRTERRLGAAQAAARLVLAADQGVAGLALGVDRGGVTAVSSPADLLSSLTSSKWVSLSSFAEQAEGSAVLHSVNPSEERIALLRTSVEHEATVLEARSVLVQPELLDGYQRMRLLTLFGTRYASPQVDFLEVAASYSERDAELHDGVRIVGASHAQLVSASSRIPIQLRNSLPFDAIVTLSAAPTSAALALDEREFPRITIASDSTERALVPVRSRVSSGDSTIMLTVSSVDGSFVASSGKLEVSIATRVETVLLVTLALLAVLLFGLGIWRSVRRRKRATAEAALGTAGSGDRE